MREKKIRGGLGVVVAADDERGQAPQKLLHLLELAPKPRGFTNLVARRRGFHAGPIAPDMAPRVAQGPAHCFRQVSHAHDVDSARIRPNRAGMAHHRALLESLREPTAEDPLRVLVSGCLAGWHCGVDASDNGVGATLGELLALPTFRALPFCPEQHALGTPRSTPDVHGGDGVDVLAGRAKILDERGGTSRRRCSRARGRCSPTPRRRAPSSRS